MSDHWISFEDISYKESDEIGRGASGIVYYGLWNNSTEVAIKRISIPATFLDADTLQEFKAEIHTLSLLRHPNIVQYLGASRSPDDDIFLITEYIGSGSLSQLLSNNPEIPTPTIIKIFRGVVAGMVYLHSRDPPLVHRDLKPQNLLIVGDFFSVKIADFGSSRLLKDAQTFSSAGTIEYMAPEVLKKAGFTTKSDVYSVGVILWELLSGAPPYPELAHEMVDYSKREKLQNLPKLTDSLRHLSQKDEFVAGLIAECLQEVPDKRPSFPKLGAFLQKYPGHTKNQETNIQD